MIDGIDPGRGPARDPGEDRRAAALGFLAAHQHQGGGAVVEARGVAGGDGAVLLEGGARPASSSTVAPSRIYSSRSTIVSPLRPLIVTGAISSVEPALGARRLGLVLRGAGEGVLLVAGDLILLGEILGGDAHVIAVEDVGQAVLDHRVDQLDVAHLGAAAKILGVGGKAHALLAAGDDDGGVAGLDRLGGERDGAQARAADLVDAPGRDLLGHAGRHRRLARRILALGGGQHLAEDHLRHLLGATPACASAASIAIRPSSCAGVVAKAPRKAPTGVRLAAVMTTSVMERLLLKLRSG
jgi:hypothetical protein